MLISIAIILLITFSGTIATYLYEKDDSLLVRVCAGNIFGSAIFGSIGFITACLFGFSSMSVIAALIISLLPLILLTNKNLRDSFTHNLRKARGKFEGATLKKFIHFIYYGSILIVLGFFFERAMLETKDGIFTGGSQNLGDLPFHLGAIFSFTEGQNFPTENPSFAGAKFTYPFLADFITASLVKLGAVVRDAMFWQNVTLSFSLVVLFEGFTLSLTKNKLAGKLAPVIFLLSGGLGFVIFFRDYWQDGRGLFEFLKNLPMDYTIRDTLRWGNPLVVLFMTQRGFLLGMPIVLIVLTYLWKIFNRETEGHRAESDQNTQIEKTFPAFLIGLLAGTLPLIHVHSLFVLFVVSGFLLILSAFDGESVKALTLPVLNRIKWRQWVAFGAGVSLIAVPELIWALTGSATNLSKFIGWNFGWDAGNSNFFIFWVKNLGVFIPLLLIALFLTQRRKGDGKDQLPFTNYQLLKFYIPFAFIFVLSNTVKLAPWGWDNIKVLIYWYLASVPFVAWLLADLWEREKLYRLMAVICLIILTFSGSLDVWRVISKQINYRIFSKNSVKIAEEIKQKTPPNALFLNAPTYNSAVVLSGRRSLMRYSGHLSSYGIDYESRENEVKRIYEGSALADGFLQKNKIEYVLISPEEFANLKVNEAYFAKYPKIAEVGEYKVYQVK